MGGSIDFFLCQLRSRQNGKLALPPFLQKLSCDFGQIVGAQVEFLGKNARRGEGAAASLARSRAQSCSPANIVECSGPFVAYHISDFSLGNRFALADYRFGRSLRLLRHDPGIAGAVALIQALNLSPGEEVKIVT